MHQSKLLSDQRFWPLFYTQFCGAFNDNVFKFALIGLILMQGKNFTFWGMNSTTLQAFAVGLFILPFFLFSSIAGQLAERYDKAKLMQIIRFTEILIMGAAIIGFLTYNIALLLVVLFLMGVVSTFFGPIKYSILPQHLKTNELLAANGLVDMATFVAILIGTMLGTYLIEISGGPKIIAGFVTSIAIAGWLFSLRVPAAPAPAPELKINFNIVSDTFRQISYARQNTIVFWSLIAISWFWFVGATVLTLINPLADEVFKGNVDMRMTFLAVTTIGIGVGSVLCEKLTAGKPANHLIVIGAIGITLFGADIYFSSTALTQSLSTLPREITSLKEFFSHAAGYRLLLDLGLFGLFGGLYIVPLYVLLQTHSEPEHRSRNIAVNNIMNAVFMVLSAAMIIALKAYGFTIPQILIITALLTIPMCLWVFKRMPEPLRDFFALFKKKDV